MLTTVCSSYLQKPKRRLQSTCPKNAYTDCRDLNWEKDNTCRIHIFMWCSFESSSHNCFSADDNISSDDSASSDASQYCPSHEDETSDESAELLLTEESEFGCQDNPDYCPTHQHQCKTVVSSVRSSSSSGTLSVSVVKGPESQEVALSAPKKRKIPVGIVLPNQVSFMELYVVLCMYIYEVS